MSFQDFKNLDVWLAARKLTNSIYSATINFPNNEQFGLTNQMRRAAVSIASNIAEGCGRNTPKGTLAFLFIARGSLFELETQVYIAFDQNYIDESLLNLIIEEIQISKKLINGFINYFKKQDHDKSS